MFQWMFLNRKYLYIFFSLKIAITTILFGSIPFISMDDASQDAITITRGNLKNIKKRVQRRIIHRNEIFKEYYATVDETYLYVCIQNDLESLKTGKTLIFYLSGFGGHHGEMNSLFPEQETILQHAGEIDYIIPCFEFTHCADKQTAQLLNTDFGQVQDLNAVLVGLKQFFLPQQARYEKLAIIGRSRGGCVAINLIGVLSTKDHPLLIQNNISENERLVLLERIIKGGVALITPLIDLKHAAQKIFGKVVGFLAYQSASLFLPRVYQKRSLLKPLKSILHWSGNQIPIVILYATQDTIVGEKYNEEFAQKLLESNGKAATIIHIEGDHNNEYIRKVAAHAITNKLLEYPDFNIADVVASLYA